MLLTGLRDTAAKWARSTALDARLEYFPRDLTRRLTADLSSRRTDCRCEVDRGGERQVLSRRVLNFSRGWRTNIAASGVRIFFGGAVFVAQD
jgi:hypothetical protein